MIKISNYTGRQTQSYKVTVGNVALYFSYETLVAVHSLRSGKTYIAANVWGPTTGRHIRETGLTHLPHEEVDPDTLTSLAEDLLREDLMWMEKVA